MATAGIDRQMACEAYDAYAGTLHRVLLQVVRCEECASALMLHALLKDCTQGGSPPSLSRLLRTALAAACVTANENGNRTVQDRIRAWYMEAQALRR